MKLACCEVNGYRMHYVDSGTGSPVVLIHGSLCDYRYWPLQGRAFSRRHRVLTPSLRHYYPERWDGRGDDFSLEQHAADMAAFIRALDLGPVHLVGHSRGGYLAYQLASEQPELLRSAVLAEPGGDLDPSLQQPGQEESARLDRHMISNALDRLRNGDVDGGLALFLDTVSGPGTWARSPEKFRNAARDNAYTLIGQVRDQPRCYSLRQAEAVGVPVLLVGGQRSPAPFPQIIQALGRHIPGARTRFIDDASHTMNLEQPEVFNTLVLDFFQDVETGEHRP
ncbi:MAG: alpha/beta hydrolase [Ectothiorhodospiraceae bacterium]|nr:alpha/beta hydrolase [Ectothiorhodospiraceae bacterium]